ncbi:RNA-guided endonuclease InsQ/TnpB family protein [Desulfobacter sp.]
MNATVSRTADKWFVSICVEMDITPATCENQAVVGVDLGIKNLATLSNGEMIEGSKQKLKRKIIRLHYRISCIRHDTLHKLTSKLVRKFSVIVIEDLNVFGMLKNRKLAKAISDMGFHEFRRQLNYKAIISGANVIVADLGT